MSILTFPKAATDLWIKKRGKPVSLYIVLFMYSLRFLLRTLGMTVSRLWLQRDLHLESQVQGEDLAQNEDR